jgi:hypothetical protein
MFLNLIKINLPLDSRLHSEAFLEQFDIIIIHTSANIASEIAKRLKYDSYVFNLKEEIYLLARTRHRKLLTKITFGCGEEKNAATVIITNDKNLKFPKHKSISGEDTIFYYISSNVKMIAHNKNTILFQITMR